MNTRQATESQDGHSLTRRRFLAATASGSTVGIAALTAHAGVGVPPPLEAGEGVVDTTPPLGIEMGGFHRKPGHERRIRAIRQATAARAIVLRSGATKTAIVSVDLAALGDKMVRRTQLAVSRATGIPAEHVRLCATHTHSMPSFCYLRQWGAIPLDYMATVQRKIVEAVRLANNDLAPTQLHLGTATAAGANFNRTTKTWKNEDAFGADATDEQRWLDRTLQVLRFQRARPKHDLLWYHFSSHPVCYSDESAGPDWPGMVAQRVRKQHGIAPSFLQGHAGDVNPGDGKKWIGEPEPTATAVFKAFGDALGNARRVNGAPLELHHQSFGVPLDMTLFRSWLDQYQRDASKCARGPWVDAGFAKAWHEANKDRNASNDTLSITLSAIRLGDLMLVFHPGELYSYYGLAIQRDAPSPHTVVVGYADGMIGYLPDPKAYAAGEYAALTVPKILDYPPFKPMAARQLTKATVNMARRFTA